MWVKTHDDRLVNLDKAEQIQASVGIVRAYLPSIDNTSVVLADFKGDQDKALAYIKALGDDLAVFEVRMPAEGDVIDADFFVETPPETVNANGLGAAAIERIEEACVPPPPKVVRLGQHGSVITDDPVRLSGYPDSAEDARYYGGNVVCESITPTNAAEMVKRWNAHEALVDGHRRVRAFLADLKHQEATNIIFWAHEHAKNITAMLKRLNLEE